MKIKARNQSFGSRNPAKAQGTLPIGKPNRHRSRTFGFSPLQYPEGVDKAEYLRKYQQYLAKYFSS